MAVKKQRVKSRAVDDAPQSKDHVIEHIALIGAKQRQRAMIEAVMNDELAAIREKYESEALPLADEITSLSAGVQSWCEAHRDEITQNRKVKTYVFASGEVKWRTRPPSVSLKKIDDVIESLKSLGLDRFIRKKEEVNKEAILAEPDVVKGVRGISIKKDEEDFVIEPFATELEKVA
jgi:phage host-nuclease inhibitor protein Gam